MKKGGNACIFCIYNILNLAFILQSLLVIAMGIWLWKEVEAPGPFNLGLIGIGFIEFLLGLGGQHVRKSKARMNIYLFFMTFLFSAQTILTTIAIASKDQILDWAAQRASSPEEADQIKQLIEGNVTASLWIAFSSVVIQLLCLWSVCVYRKSFILRNEEDGEYLLLNKGAAISMSPNQTTPDSRLKNYDNLKQQHDKKYGDIIYSGSVDKVKEKQKSTNKK